MTASLPLTASPTIPSPDGVLLRVRRWPVEQPRGVVVIAHGHGEHGGCYEHVAAVLNAPPVQADVVALDFRGHGRSPGPRGVVGRYEELVADLAVVIDAVRQERPGLPLFVLGHSNGGQVALRYVLERPSELAGMVLTNPVLGLAFPAPAWKVLLGRLLRRIAPTVTLSAEMGLDVMNSDTAAWPARRADRLRHDRINAAFYFGMIEGGRRVVERAGAITTPTLLLLGEADPIVDLNATRRFFERLGAPDKTLKAYPAIKHEPLNDLGRDEVFDDLTAWLLSRIGDRPSST